MANKSENKKKRKAPEKRIEGEVCVNGGWCGRFVKAVCLYLEECLYLEVCHSSLFVLGGVVKGQGKN